MSPQSNDGSAWSSDVSAQSNEVSASRGCWAGTVCGVHLVETYHEGPWSVTAVVGELDVVGGPELRQHLLALLREDGSRLVLDLSGVDFIDSFGLGVIVGALKRTRLLDGDLRLVVPAPRIRRVFEVCDLDRVFKLHRTVQEAVSTL